MLYSCRRFIVAYLGTCDARLRRTSSITNYIVLVGSKINVSPTAVTYFSAISKKYELYDLRKPSTKIDKKSNSPWNLQDVRNDFKTHINCTVASDGRKTYGEQDHRRKSHTRHNFSETLSLHLQFTQVYCAFFKSRYPFSLQSRLVGGFFVTRGRTQ